MHRVTSKSTVGSAAIFEETDAAKAVTSVANNDYNIVGGTAWLWSKQMWLAYISLLQCCHVCGQFGVPSVDLPAKLREDLAATRRTNFGLQDPAINSGSYQMFPKRETRRE
jgi:hypothetical protein